MKVETLTASLNQTLGIPEADIIYRGVLAFIQNEIRSAELEIANIRERYTVFSKEELYDAVKNGTVITHPAWEDYIVWKNKLAHIAYLRQLATG